MLTDEQIDACLQHGQWLSENATRSSQAEALQRAYRLGLLRAAEVCEEHWRRAFPADVAEIIRAEAGE